MIAGHLREKDGHYYCVLSYTDYTGERKQIWKATGLPVKGNKKRAEEMLSHLRKSFVVPRAPADYFDFSDRMLFNRFYARLAGGCTNHSSAYHLRRISDHGGKEVHSLL